ncbi:MAG: hypothetical protein KKH61_21145 [Gammaproteobacteria bacterium]|nr:hypothetical protein [Gammaproteobacteria bacterium]
MTTQPSTTMLTLLTTIAQSLSHHSFSSITVHAGGRITLISRWRAEQFESVEEFVKWLERANELCAANPVHP